MILLYLDPGSGSFLIQLLIAGIAGLGIAIGASWSKIKRFLNRNKKKTETDDDEDEDIEIEVATAPDKQVTRLNEQQLTSSARLPEKCSSCGAGIRPNEVKWLDDVTAECHYCGSVIKAATK